MTEDRESNPTSCVVLCPLESLKVSDVKLLGVDLISFTRSRDQLLHHMHVLLRLVIFDARIHTYHPCANTQEQTVSGLSRV